MYIYVLFIKGFIHDTSVDQPRKFTKVCTSEQEAREEFKKYFKFEAYIEEGAKESAEKVSTRAAAHLAEYGYTDGTFSDFTWLATLTKVDVTPKAF